MTMRTLTDDLERRAADAALAAVHSIDLSGTLEQAGRSPASGFVLDLQVDDRHLVLPLEVVSYCTGGWAARTIAKPTAEPHHLVVADKITAEARQLLSAAGWSWLDRRGRLHLRGTGVRIDADVPSEGDTGQRIAPPLAGRSGITVAYWLCSNPGHGLSPTRSAPILRLAPSSISTAVRRLAEAGLVDEDGAAVLPELFWELADVWRPEWTWLAESPEPQAAVDPDRPGWRLTGTAAAVAYGAPLVAAGAQPLQLYVLGPVEVSIAARQHGVAKPGLGTPAVAAPPTSLVTAPPGPGEELVADGWPPAPLVAVALDLAQDRARGREILQGWEAGHGIWA